MALNDPALNILTVVEESPAVEEFSTAALAHAGVLGWKAHDVISHR